MEVEVDHESQQKNPYSFVSSRSVQVVVNEPLQVTWIVVKPSNASLQIEMVEERKKVTKKTSSVE